MRHKKAADQVGMGEVLFSGTRRRVLGLFFGQPEREFRIGELIQLAGAGSGAVQREVARMAECGLLSVRREGRQKWYQANRESPVYEELCSMVRKTIGPSATLKDAVAELPGRVDLALMFGSTAKGAARADSDIDVLLVSDELRLEDVFRVFQPVERELGRQVNPLLYTSAEFDQRMNQGSAFLQRIFDGEYTILKGEFDGGGGTGQPGTDRPAQEGSA